MAKLQTTEAALSNTALFQFFPRLQNTLNRTQSFDFLALLALRLYLTPIFWMAGTQKLYAFENTVEWFGNSDWGLGLPFPYLMAVLATASELIGAVSLLVGFAVRWNAIPLMITMLVAIFSVHWNNGWLAIASGQGPFATERTMEAIERLDRAKMILKQHGDYSWLTEQGHFVILNNGIEFAATYFVMLLVVFFYGAGRYVSVDYWVKRAFNKKPNP